MTASFVWDSEGRYTYPAIVHAAGRCEVLREVPHISPSVARKYAQIEINARRLNNA